MTPYVTTNQNTGMARRKFVAALTEMALPPPLSHADFGLFQHKPLGADFTAKPGRAVGRKSRNEPHALCRAKGSSNWTKPPRSAAVAYTNSELAPCDADTVRIRKSTLLDESGSTRDAFYVVWLENDAPHERAFDNHFSAYLYAAQLECRLQIAALDSESALIEHYISRPAVGDKSSSLSPK